MKDDLKRQRLDLYYEWRAGSAVALNRLCKSCEGFIEWVAWQYTSRLLSHEDLVSEGWLAFLEGVKHYNPEDNDDILNAVGFFVRQRIARAAAGSKSSAMERVFSGIGRAESSLEAQGIALTDENIANQLGCASHYVTALRSSNASMPDDIDSNEAVDFDVVEEIDKQEVLTRIRAALADLPDRDREVIVDHYLKGKTLYDIGLALGVTKMGALYIERRALEALKEALHDVARD